MNEQSIPFEAKVRDTLTGYQGVVTSFIVYRNGTASYQVEAIDSTGRLNFPWIDSDRLEVVE